LSLYTYFRQIIGIFHAYKSLKHKSENITDKLIRHDTDVYMNSTSYDTIVVPRGNPLEPLPEAVFYEYEVWRFDEP
jgi:hypothetical protein